MKNLGFVALSGLALLQGAAAVCCRTNKCLKAIVYTGQDGLADCSANLIVTVTPSASTLTQTVTDVESAVATALLTKATTETASTETLLFTETTTITASTETDIISETTTVPVTTTDVQLAAGVTSTSTVYLVNLKARQTGSPLPGYASGVCPDWDKYVEACKCAGVVPITVTATAATETVTVTADSAVTSTMSTLSSTQTDTVSVTATTSSTQTDTISLTETVTTTETTTASSTTTVLTTSTPTTVVPLTCKPQGLNFRVSSPLNDGTTRWMNVINKATIAWQTFSSGSTGTDLYSSTWVLDSNGYLGLANAIAPDTSVLVAYVDLSKTGASVAVQAKPKPDVEAAVAAGTFGRVTGCVNAATSEVTLSANGRSNILTCGNGLYLSTGNGVDIRSDCVQLFPTGNQV
ncbi:hypothetical protein QBC33DRAFT_553690 [Phialemonium atrogriseum]|uniref:CBM1 domain-containing protein n=1 Tax=Phialemonium atrogriseum TaxID=1093897 RepID=A0AAJ0C8R0_9PEZI|nr:uncharacterized protein QBC33DRAFT_553690 [Phialemonium atrogriseum]KAK1772238.1 hypothetical protein QBC33DRAFT_553690 [Phialemonium atrogriseum]